MPAAQVATNHDPETVRLVQPDLNIETTGPRCGAGSPLDDAVPNTLPVSESHG